MARITGKTEEARIQQQAVGFVDLSLKTREKRGLSLLSDQSYFVGSLLACKERVLFAIIIYWYINKQYLSARFLAYVYCSNQTYRK